MHVRLRFRLLGGLACLFAPSLAQAEIDRDSFAALLGAKHPDFITSHAVAAPGSAISGWYERSPAAMSVAFSPPFSLEPVVIPIDVAASTQISPVPEPSTYALLLAGVAAIGFVARKRSAPAG